MWGISKKQRTFKSAFAYSVKIINIDYEKR